MFALPPVLFMAFANSEPPFLDALKKERKAISNHLMYLSANGQVQVVVESEINSDEIITYFLNYGPRISIFHFGGHADAGQLFLEESTAYVQGLASTLGSLPNLKLVFLNGCFTHMHVKQLLEAGVKAVIATYLPIEDKIAEKFASFFYEALSLHYSLSEAFQKACDGIRLQHFQYVQDEPLITPYNRGLVRGKTGQDLPWELFINQSNLFIQDWKFDRPRFKDKKLPKHLTAIPPLDPQNPLVGREEYLERLHEDLKKSENGVIISGMPGIGKTSLANAYVRQFEGEYEHIVWIDQASDLEQAFTSNIRLLQNLAFVDGHEKRNATELLQIRKRLGGLPGPSLLVLDAADFSLLDYSIPLITGNWNILITSNIVFAPFNAFNLGPLPGKEASQLFYQLYKWDRNDFLLEKILLLIDHHTLAIEFIAKMAQSGKLQLLEIYRILLDSGLNLPFSSRTSMAHSGYKAIDQLFPYLSKMFNLADLNNQELVLLRRFALLPSVYIKYETLEGLIRMEKFPEGKLPFGIVLSELVHKNFIQYDQETESYLMGHILQDIVLSEEGLDEQHLLLLIETFTNRLEIDQDQESYLDKIIWVPFGERLLKLVKGPIISETALMQSHLGIIYYELGQSLKAEEIQKEALALSMEKYGEFHPNTGLILSNLGLVLLNKQPEMARYLFEKALSIEQDNPEPSNAVLALRKSNLAQAYYKMELWEEAKKATEEALALNREIFESFHPSINRKMANLAVILTELEAFEEARQLLEEALAGDRKSFEAFHPSISKKLSTLSYVYKEQGDFKKAKRLMEESIDIEKANLGASHQNVAIRYRKLARINQLLQDYQSAQEQLELSIYILEKELGENHKNALEVKPELIEVLIAAGEQEEAKSLWYETFKVANKKLDSNQEIIMALKRLSKKLERPD